MFLKFSITIIFLSFVLLVSACDDNIDEKIQTEKKISESAKKPIHEVFYSGNDGVIIINHLEEDSIRIKWTKSKGENSHPLEVIYSIFYSLENNIDTIEDAKENGLMVYQDFNINHYNINDLEEETTYFINIIAENDNGDEIIYNTASAETSHH